MCMLGHWNLTTDILHNLRNDEITPFSLYFLSQNFTRLQGVNLKISCLFLKESSHDIVESSRYIPRDRNTEIELNSGAVIAPKRLTRLKSVPLRLQRFCVYRFWASGSPILYVCGDTFILSHFAYINLPITWWRNPRKLILCREGWKRNTYISLNQFVFEHR